MMADQAQRYQDMAEFMKLVALGGNELTVEERKYLSTAYKNLVSTRRNAWRGVSNLEKSEVEKGNSRHLETIRGYRMKIEGELKALCEELLQLIDDGPLTT
jgi:14-3-3 protein epsilon